MGKFASQDTGGTGDAATLQGHPASYFAVAAHVHTWAEVTSGVPTTLVYASGTPLIHQVAFWNDSTHLTGEAGFEWDSTDFTIPGNVLSAGDVLAYSSGGSSPVIWDATPVDDVTIKYDSGEISLKPALTGNSLKVLRVNSTETGIEWAVASSGGTSDHSALSNLDYNHAGHTGFSPTVHNFINTTNHPVSGLTAGHFLKALSATTYGFDAIVVADISGAAPLASPHFTGTVYGINAAMVGALSVGGTAANSLQLGGLSASTYAPLANPHFIGNVSIGTTASVSRLTLGGGSANSNPNAGVEVDYEGLDLTFKCENPAAITTLGEIKLVQPTGYYVDGADMVFKVATGGTLTERMRISKAGNVISAGDVIAYG